MESNSRRPPSPPLGRNQNRPGHQLFFIALLDHQIDQMAETPEVAGLPVQAVGPRHEHTIVHMQRIGVMVCAHDKDTCGPKDEKLHMDQLKSETAEHLIGGIQLLQGIEHLFFPLQAAADIPLF